MSASAETHLLKIIGFGSMFRGLFVIAAIGGAIALLLYFGFNHPPRRSF